MELLEASFVLCKQGAAGSSPATSTNYMHFNDMPLKFARYNPCYSSRFSFPLQESDRQLVLHNTHGLQS